MGGVAHQHHVPVGPALQEFGRSLCSTLSGGVASRMVDTSSDQPLCRDLMYSTAGSPRVRPGWNGRSRPSRTVIAWFREEGRRMGAMGFRVAVCERCGQVCWGRWRRWPCERERETRSTMLTKCKEENKTFMNTTTKSSLVIAILFVNHAIIAGFGWRSSRLQGETKEMAGISFA